MEKKILRQETLLILDILIKDDIDNIVKAITFNKLSEKLKEREIQVGKTALRAHVKMLLELKLIFTGCLSVKNAKTYYVNKEKAEKFIVNTQTIKEQKGEM